MADADTLTKQVMRSWMEERSVILNAWVADLFYQRRSTEDIEFVFVPFGDAYSSRRSATLRVISTN